MPQLPSKGQSSKAVVPWCIPGGQFRRHELVLIDNDNHVFQLPVVSLDTFFSDERKYLATAFEESGEILFINYERYYRQLE